MIVQVVPAIIAVGAEYIFIFKMHMGVTGSALAAWGLCMGPWFLLVCILFTARLI